MTDGYQVFRDLARPGVGAMDWGRLIWLVNRASTGVDVTVGYVEIAPEVANPVHRHHTCSEMLFVLEGEIQHSVGEESERLEAGDLLLVPPGMAHGAANIDTTAARMIVVYDTGERDFELVE